MSDLAAKQLQLAEAEAAYHKLMLGQSAVSVSESGRAVSYTAATAGSLAAYIDRLKAEIARLGGSSSRRGPIYVS